MRLSCIALVFLGAVLASASAANQSWSSAEAPEGVVMGITCPTTNLCYLAGMDNNVGSQILFTADGGQTWQNANYEGKAMMLLANAQPTATSGITTGIGMGASPNTYTTDGFNYTAANPNSLITECQGAGAIEGVDGGFVLVGQFGKIDGIAVSRDGGVTYSNFDWMQNTTSRYGSFPSDNAFFISGGQFPSDNEDNEYFHLTRRIHIHRASHTLRFMATPPPMTNASWAAALSKSVDGGNTWENLFFSENEFYFNQISCSDELNCVAVGEGESDAFNGAGAFVTHDGGNTWNMTWYADGVSLMASYMLNAKEVFVGGGVFDNAFTGHILHSVDGGNTWDVDLFPGLYINDFSFPNNDNSLGYASAFTEDSDSAILTYQ